MPDKNKKLTPLMEQYFSIREQYPDAILLFQVGDFYEVFFEDAKRCAEFLGITLTKRGKCEGKDIPIAGVPVSSLNHYLSKLVKGGFKVALCDQVSKPVPGEIVRREVTRVYTPGTLTDDSMLDSNKPSFLCSLWPGKNNCGVIFTELLTSQVFATIFKATDHRALDSELAKFSPDEIVFPKLNSAIKLENYFKKQGFITNFATPLQKENTNFIEENDFNINHNQLLKDYFEKEIKKEILETALKDPNLNATFGLLASYLFRHHKNVLPQVEEIKFYKPDNYLLLDSATLKNLEIVKKNTSESKENSLFSVLDKTKTSMGSRALRHALTFPLIEIAQIKNRQDAVEAIKSSVIHLANVENHLSEIPDIERIVGRISLDKANIKDFLLLKRLLSKLPFLKQILFAIPKTERLHTLAQFISEQPEVAELLEASLNEEEDLEYLIKPGFDFELDRLRNLADNSKSSLLQLEIEEIKQTEISSLKVKYTDIHGYFIEISKLNLKLVPERYKLQQTLVNRSRFTTPELESLAQEINLAKEKITSLESEIFSKIKNQVKDEVTKLRTSARAIAEVDLLFSLAKAAYDNNYHRPKFINQSEIEINKGRHPVIEQKITKNFIANDLKFTDNSKLHIITGPNMGGKSTYLRQNAHIVLMAHVGSFVPAEKCQLPIIDRIFTRIGSGDDLAAGKSTFLVEMEEASQICSQATKNSLVILDEVGRGTSTYDGMAIAQAIIEHLRDISKSFCLFATHYHELTEIQNTKSSEQAVKNMFVDCYQNQNNIIFLHQLKPGVAKQSFGIQVAKLAGLPDNIINRANLLLTRLKDDKKTDQTVLQTNDQELYQTAMSPEDPKINLLKQKVSKLDMDDISFKQAHKILEDIKNQLV